MMSNIDDTPPSALKWFSILSGEFRFTEKWPKQFSPDFTLELSDLGSATLDARATAAF
jgi:hypothetical protein